MKIAVDTGAMCSLKNERFGNYFFTENLLKAMEKFDQTNDYHFYSFCKMKSQFKYTKLPAKLFRFWGAFDDVVLALNQQPPLYTRGKIISFCHGLSYYFYPQYYSKEDVFRLEKQLKEMVKRSDLIIVSSEKVKTELVSMYQYIDTKIVVLPFGIPFDMLSKLKVIKSIKSKTREKYFLYVGMEHRIKNIDFIKKAFEKFRTDKKYKDYKLYLITKNISRKKLQQLYQKATALLTASHYESFNFPVLEALVNNCPIIGLKSSIIPEMKKFVNICNNNIEEFVLKMKKISIEKQEIDLKKLKNIFSWKKYIEKLCRNYQQ